MPTRSFTWLLLAVALVAAAPKPGAADPSGRRIPLVVVVQVVFSAAVSLLIAMGNLF